MIQLLAQFNAELFDLTQKPFNMNFCGTKRNTSDDYFKWPSKASDWWDRPPRDHPRS